MHGQPRTGMGSRQDWKSQELVIPNTCKGASHPTAVQENHTIISEKNTLVFNNIANEEILCKIDIFSFLNLLHLLHTSTGASTCKTLSFISINKPIIRT